MPRSKKSIRPRRLRPGDVIGLVSPASTPASSEKIEQAVRYFEKLGYRTKTGRHVLDQLGYLAGTDADRAADLNEMIEDHNVRAIVALRGGYGTPRILDRINYRALRRDPKILVGYSDLTALLLSVFRHTGMITFSGPMAGVEMAGSIDPFTEEHFWRMVSESGAPGLLENPADDPVTVSGRGRAGGILLGGNLSLVLSLLATPYSPSFRKSIMVLEDVDEAPHRVDRMFAQLRLAGILGTISALLLGRFTDCHPADPKKPFLTIDQVLDEVRNSLSVPVISNFLYGHIPRKVTLPIGARTIVDAAGGRIEVVESVVR